MNKIILALCLLSLSACSFVDDFNEMLVDQKQAQSIVKKQYGFDSQFGLNVNNGKLVQITLTLSAADARKRTIGELEKIVAQVVPEVFDQTPQQVLIIVHNY